MKFLLTSLAVATTLAIQPAPHFAGIEWQTSYEAALRLADEQQRVVFVAVDHMGEGRCERFMKELLRDKVVLARAAETVNVPVSFESHKERGACPRFKGLECSDHRRSGVTLLESTLPRNDKGVVAVPQYLWLDGQGSVLLSVAYEIEREGLLWCFETAQRMVNKETATALSPEARPPRRLLMGRAYQPTPGDDRARGMTASELEEVLDETNRSFMGMANVGRILRVMFTDHPEAVEYVRVELTGVLKTFAIDRVVPTIHALGTLSPAPFWEALEAYTGDKDPEVRHEVAVAFEQLGAGAALRLVKTAMKGEKDERLKGAWLRALGASGPTDKASRKALIDISGDEGEALSVRASAAFALGYMERHADIRARWFDLLASATPSLRLAAAYGMALARDAECLTNLETAAAKAEGDEKASLESALTVLRGGDLYPIGAELERITGDSLARERIFFGVIP